MGFLARGVIHTLCGLALLCALLGRTTAPAAAPQKATADAGLGSEPPPEPGGSEQAESASDDSKPAIPYQPKPAAPLPTLTDNPGKVLVIPISGTVELGMAAFVERGLMEVDDVAVVILDVNTFGGRVDAAVKIRDGLLAAKVPTVAFVNRRAISAGALISLAADHIVFTSGGSLGAATPVQVAEGQAEAVGEKMTSYMRSEMRATAEAKGRDGDIAEAMVDASVVIQGVSKQGKLLTLATQQALDTGIASAQLESLEALKHELGKGSAPTEQLEPNWAEQVVRVLTEPTFAGILMSVGMAALLIDIYTAGFGLTGILGLSCLSLFFGGHYLVGLAGWEELLLFLVGVGALIVEVFILPGFGVAGMIGVLALLASLTMSMLSLSLWDSWETGLLTPALAVVLMSLIAIVVLVAAAFWFLGSRGRAGGGWLVLRATLSKGNVADAVHTRPDEPTPENELVGRTGAAMTDLRLSGKAEIDGHLHDVVSEMSYVRKGASVKVVHVEGPRIVVVETTSTPPGENQTK